MDGQEYEKEKALLKQRLGDMECPFSLEELQSIIDREFFDDTNVLDTDLVDAAARRIAALKGIDAEEQFKETAHEALRRILGIEK